MSDWITHLGFAYLGARALEVRETRVVLLGAVLPDVAIPVFVLVDLLHLSPWGIFTYLAPIHSLPIVVLLAAAIALIHVRPGYCLRALLGGALTHFALDILETDVDCGMRVLYPFSFHTWSPGWLVPGRAPAITLLIISSLALAAALSRPIRPACSPFRVKNLPFAGLLLVLATTFPLLTRQMLVAENVHFLGFLAHPATWEGQSVELCFSEVVATNPPTIEEFGRRFELVTNAPLRASARVSVQGTYCGGLIYPTDLYVHQGFSEAWLSLIGLGALATIWLRSLTDRKEHRSP